MNQAEAVQLAYQITRQGYRVRSIVRARTPHDWRVVVEARHEDPIEVFNESYWQALAQGDRVCPVRSAVAEELVGQATLPEFNPKES